MGTLIDLSGKTFGQLVVLERVKIPNENESHWRCRCTCGKETVVLGGNLKSGNTKSCGCTSSERSSATKVIDITGQRFGKLVVLYKVGISKMYGMMWHCKCDCGKECDVSGTFLRRGHTSSCGCNVGETASNNFLKDLTGKKFGYLTVIDRAANNGTNVMWNCICDCGNKTSVRAGNLISGTTTSCGCRKISYGEEKIQDILNENNIKYLYNKGYFKDLISSVGGLLRYDFILFDEETPYRIIEFDGTQHNAPQEHFGGEEKFLHQKENDFLKNQYALSHNIPLVRIPYSKRNSMTLEDLLGDKYLIKETDI